MSGIHVQQDFFAQGPSGFLRVELPGHGQARACYPATAKAAAGLIAAKAGSARVLLLGAYIGVEGLTDEEAAERAGVSMLSECATRVSELVRYQMLFQTGEERPGRSGVPRRVCRITDYGLHVLGQRNIARTADHGGVDLANNDLRGG